ncbi:DUF1360 domain-containing protein [Microbispora cellulosiformans]|uniref:DUF1360 domain-containing protein n=1 Tax=Microbispora cellulosiformans TaxID=2614688 RepID=A0A5J5K7I6_9ACTN|nr:DUF1360 domain-containing protein [Microbispora cellulosiformans]
MIGLVELGVLAFAGYRATQLVINDTILDPARDVVFRWRDRRPTSQARDWAVTLISCPYCMGWWLSGAILAVYLLVAGRWGDTSPLIHGIEWFAVAGAAVLLNRADTAMGQG